MTSATYIGFDLQSVLDVPSASLPCARCARQSASSGQTGEGNIDQEQVNGESTVSDYGHPMPRSGYPPAAASAVCRSTLGGENQEGDGCCLRRQATVTVAAGGISSLTVQLSQSPKLRMSCALRCGDGVVDAECEARFADPIRMVPAKDVVLSLDGSDISALTAVERRWMASPKLLAGWKSCVSRSFIRQFLR